MCPACFAAAAWAVAGTTSAGGLTVFVVRKFKGRKQRRSEIATTSIAESPRDERKRP
jgi:hypothetical protein